MNLFKCKGEVYEKDTYKNSKTFYSSSGTEKGTQTWDIDLGKLVKALSAKIDATNSKYTLCGRATTSDSWTTLVDWARKTGDLTEITNKDDFRYFRVTCQYASESWWVDPAGIYYSAYANNLTINYKYKKN